MDNIISECCKNSMQHERWICFLHLSLSISLPVADTTAWNWRSLSVEASSSWWSSHSQTWCLRDTPKRDNTTVQLSIGKMRPDNKTTESRYEACAGMSNLAQVCSCYIASVHPAVSMSSSWFVYEQYLHIIIIVAWLKSSQRSQDCV